MLCVCVTMCMWEHVHIHAGVRGEHQVLSVPLCLPFLMTTLFSELGSRMTARSLRGPPVSLTHSREG